MVKEIDQFMEQVEINGYQTEVFNYPAIAEEAYPINILIAERGERGKTYGLKGFQYAEAKRRGITNRHQCLWLRSLKDDAIREGNKFLGNVPKNIQADMEKLSMKNTKNGNAVIHQDLGLVFRFSNVSTANSPKGTRELFQEIVWDEFNESINSFKSKLIDNFSSIFVSSDDPNDRPDNKNPMRLWLLGNNKGFNHPFLVRLGISYVGKEVTRIVDKNGNKLALIIMPMYSNEEIEKIKKKKEHDWGFIMNEMLGTADHIYFNKSDFDELNYIHRYIELPPHEVKVGMENLKKFHLKATFRINNEFINIYQVPKNLMWNTTSTFHVVHIASLQAYYKRFGQKLELDTIVSHYNNGKTLIHATKPQDVEEGIVMLPSLWKREQLANNAKNMFSFETESARALFFDLIT